jgi:hypothetical protein
MKKKLKRIIDLDNFKLEFEIFEKIGEMKNV